MKKSSVKFLYRSKADLAKLEVRVNFNSIQYSAATNIYIQKKYWNSSKQYVIHGAENNALLENEQIELLRKAINNFLYKEHDQNTTLKQNWLKVVLAKKRGVESSSNKLNNHFVYFKDYVEYKLNQDAEYVKSEKAIDRLERNRKHLKWFVEECGLMDIKLPKIADIDVDYVRRYVSFLENDYQLGNSTVIGRVAFIKRYLKLAEKRDNIKINFDTSETIEIAINDNSDVDKIYLTDKRVKEIVNLRLEGRLEVVRQFFVIGLKTGLRHSDLRRLKLSDFHFEIKKIKVTSKKLKKKTAQVSVIPIFSEVMEILELNNGQLPVLPNKSKEYFTEKISEICKILRYDEKVYGVKPSAKNLLTKKRIRRKKGTYHFYELVSTHIMRKSSATNLLIKGASNISVMTMHGWKELSQMYHYLNMTGEEAASDLHQFDSAVSSKPNKEITPVNVETDDDLLIKELEAKLEKKRKIKELKDKLTETN